MPFALLIFGIVLVVAAVRNTQDDLFGLVKGDMTGPKNFLYWFIALLFIGVLGYVPDLKKFSNTFLVLVIIVILLSNKGFFVKFQQQIGGTVSGGTVTGG
jgi:hypothetical protein